MNGWNLKDFNSLNDVLGDSSNLKYEIDNCVRGSYTHCKTYEELADYIRDIADRLNDCANYLEFEKMEGDEDEE